MFFPYFFCLAVRSLLLNPNLTTVTAMKSALESSTTSTPMVSNGMTFLATTKNQLFVNFKSMDSNSSQIELTNINETFNSTLLPKLRKKEFCTLLLKIYSNKILKMLPISGNFKLISQTLNIMNIVR